MRADRIRRLERAAPRIAQAKPAIDATALSDATLAALMAVREDHDRDRKAAEILSEEGADQ